MFNWIKRYLRSEKVLFADLDGTIIVTKSGKTFPEDNEDWKFKEGILKALIKYNPTHLFIVSNQGGIEKGFVNRSEFVAKMDRIVHDLQLVLPKTKINYIYCPYNEKTHELRKPNTGMLEYFYHDYIGNNDFNKRNALMIGDASGLNGNFSDSDYQCAKRFGIKYIDVQMFIEWGEPCKYCSLRDKDCKYSQDPDLVNSFTCDEELSISYHIKHFEQLLNQKSKI